MGIDYKSNGIESDLANKFYSRISSMMGKTHNAQTLTPEGGYSSLYEIDQHRLLTAVTDGVGSKVKLALDAGIHNTIGIDLVSLCVNDLICSGARPLFLLNYLASGKLNLDISEKITEGIVEGCLQSQVAMLGGEATEMPTTYHHGDYDLVGFVVGEVLKKDLIDGMRIQKRDTLIGIASQGFHTNGFSLIRKVIDKESGEERKKQLRLDCLTPTKNYLGIVQSLKSCLNEHLKGLAHVTGSGLYNVSRINQHFDYEISFLPPPNDLPSFMVEVMERTGLNRKELCHTFNMGIGMVLATDKPDIAMECLSQLEHKAWVLGQVQPGTGVVHLR